MPSRDNDGRLCRSSIGIDMSNETEDKSGFQRRVGGRATANGSGMETMDVSAYEPDDEGGRNIGYCIGTPLSITAWISISDGMLGKETFPWLDRALRSSVDVDWYDPVSYTHLTLPTSDLV